MLAGGLYAILVCRTGIGQHSLQLANQDGSAMCRRHGENRLFRLIKNGHCSPELDCADRYGRLHRFQRTGRDAVTPDAHRACGERFRNPQTPPATDSEISSSSGGYKFRESA